MTVTSLVAVVAPRTGKIIKNGPVFLKKEKICYKMVYYTLYLSTPIVRNLVTKITKQEFTWTKN